MYVGRLIPITCIKEESVGAYTQNGGHPSYPRKVSRLFFGESRSRVELELVTERGKSLLKSFQSLTTVPPIKDKDPWAILQDLIEILKPKTIRALPPVVRPRAFVDSERFKDGMRNRE